MSARPPRRASRNSLATVVLGALLLLAAFVPAASAAGAGSVTLALGGKGKAADGLSAAGVEIGAIAPARKRGKRVTLPVRTVTVGKRATVALRGGIRFKAGKRSLALRSVRVVLTARRATIGARVGKRRLPVLTADLPRQKAKLDRSKVTARLAGAKLALTPRAARLLRNTLAVDDIPAGPLGQVVLAPGTKQGSGDAKPGTGGSGGGSDPGSGPPQSGPIENEPPVLARPAGAVDVTSASLTWRPRESWIQYINGGEGTSVFGGALEGPEEARPGYPALVYSFHGFPFSNGWYHAATGTAAIYFAGGVGFRWSAHGIDFSAASPEIEINGEASRAIFTFNGTQSTQYTDQRGVLVDLDPGPPQPPSAGTIAYTDVPGTIPADTGESVFAGFYPADTPFGTMTVSFTTPTP